jgi:hypothetical protein
VVRQPSAPSSSSVVTTLALVGSDTLTRPSVGASGVVRLWLGAGRREHGRRPRAASVPDLRPGGSSPQRPRAATGGALEIRGDHALLPKFYGCDFLQIDGVRQKEDLPTDRFLNCEYDDFVMSDSTTDSMLELPYSPSVLVGLVVLKKLYVQQGAGRKDSALRRGMPPRYYQVVNDVMGVLLSAGLVVSTRRGSTKVWVPLRAQRSRVTALLEAANSGEWPEGEDLVERLSSLD